MAHRVMEAEDTDSGGVDGEEFQKPHHSIGAASSKSRKPWASPRILARRPPQPGGRHHQRTAMTQKLLWLPAWESVHASYRLLPQNACPAPAPWHPQSK